MHWVGLSLWLLSTVFAKGVEDNNTNGSLLHQPHQLPLSSADSECNSVYGFDTMGPYRQEEAKSRAKEKIYYYRETDSAEDDPMTLTKDEFGLVCFTKMINCTVPPTATSALSRKTPNCVYFSKEFCTRLYGQMRWKGRVCPPTPTAPQDFQCPLEPLGGSGHVEVANPKNKTLICKNSDSLCLSLKPPFHTRSGSSDRNPPTQALCLCPLGYTGTTCSRVDIDLFHLDLLHNVDLRNILLKYQQKDRYFIGVTLLLLLIVTLSSVLLVVAGCSFLFTRIPSLNYTHKITSNPTTNIVAEEIRRVRAIIMETILRRMQTCVQHLQPQPDEISEELGEQPIEEYVNQRGASCDKEQKRPERVPVRSHQQSEQEDWASVNV